MAESIRLAASRPEAGVLAELQAVVGPEHVALDAQRLAAISRTTEPTSTLCRYAVFPGSASEVAQVMRIASRYGLPVWPFSRGNNWGYGTKNALNSGAIILMLERMNRIIEVNEALAYAVVEPGVTQQQLHEYLEAHHPKLIADCTDSTPLGSVLGNAIERGYGYSPAGDHFAHLCGLEVVLPSGELLRTGGAGARCPTFHTHKWGSGPSLEGLFSQGNLGVVVSGGIWLSPRPERIVLFTLDLEARQLTRAVDVLHQLALEGTVQGHVHMANAFQTLSLIERYPASAREAGRPLTADELATSRRTFGIPEWNAIGGLFGTQRQVRARRRDLARAVREVGTVSFFEASQVDQVTRLLRWSAGGGPLSWVARAIKSVMTPKDVKLVSLLPEMFGLLHGKPTWRVLQSAYFKSAVTPAPTDLDPARDGCGLMWLAPAVPMTGAHAQTILGLVEPLFAKFAINLSACLTMMSARTVFLLLGIFFDPQNRDERARADALYGALSSMLAEHGYQQYRGGVSAWAHGNPNRDLAGAQLLGQLKAAIDPSNVLAPGRYHT